MASCGTSTQPIRELGFADTLPADENRDQPGLFKVWGSSSNSVWIAGASGTLARAMRTTASSWCERVQPRSCSRCTRGAITWQPSGHVERLVARGSRHTLTDKTPPATPLLQGIWIDDGTACGRSAWAARFCVRAQGYQAQDSGLDFSADQSLHSVWVDPAGGVWAVGGKVLRLISTKASPYTAAARFRSSI